MDISQRQPKLPKRKLPWKSHNNSFEENVAAIKMARESFLKNTPISLENAANDKESRILRKSIKIVEMARNAQPFDRFQQGQTPSISELIINDFRPEEEKFGTIECHSDHSSQDDMPVEVSKDEIENIVVSVTKDPVNGKITFITKLVNNKKLNVEYRVVKVKAIGNFVPKLNQIRSLGNYTLYEIQVNSFMKKIVIELLVDGQSVAKSREISFSARQIFMDLELSFNLDKKFEIKMNQLEGLLASCVLEGEEFTKEFLELNGKKELKMKFLNERYTVDEETRQLVRDNKNPGPILKLLKTLMEDKSFKFGIAPEYLTNPAYLTLVQIFIEQMLKFKPAMGRDQRQEISTEESINLIQLFSHFICLLELKTKGFSIETNEKDVQAKLDELIHYAFQVSQIKIYHQFIIFCINKQLPILPQGYDTIRDYIVDYNLNSLEYLRTNLENIYYTVVTKRVKVNPVKLFLQVFKDKKFQNGNIYDKQMENIMVLSNGIFKLMDINTLSFQEFTKFFKTYWNFRQNEKLSKVARQSPLRGLIQNYMNSFKNKFQTADPQQKSNGIAVVELYYITLRDEELVQDEEGFKKVVQYLIEKSDPKSFDLVVKLYFEIFKRGGRGFSMDFIRNLSGNLSKKLQQSKPDTALTLLGKYFNEEYLESQQIATICNENLLKPIIAKLIPQSNLKKGIEQFKENHFAWHGGFKYPNYFNQQILEKMVRVVQVYYGSDNMAKLTYLSQIKRQIEREVQDEESKSSLLAIIQIDLLQLDYEHLWQYVTFKKGYLKILNKIIKRSDSTSEKLKQSLMDMQNEIEQRRVPFEKIQQIKSMRPNQWHNFVQLADEYGIPSLVNEIYEEGTTYIRNLKKVQNFVREIGVKFTSPNYEQLCIKLQSLASNFFKDSIKSSRFEQIPIFKEFKQDILTCYKLKPFFGTENLSKKPIQEIIKYCGQLLQKLQIRIKEVYRNYENGTITSDNIYYFQPKKDDVAEFRNILLMNKEQNVSQSIDQIIKLYQIIADSQVNYRLFNGLAVISRQKFNIEIDQVIHFVKICAGLNNKTSMPIKELPTRLSAVYLKLKEYKLNFKENKQFFEVLARLAENSEKIKFFKSIQRQLKDIKDEINESGGDIEYEQIEDCEAAIEFLNEVYDIETTFPQFISAYFSFIEQKKKTIKDFALDQTLKTAFFIVPQLKELKANMQDSNRSAVKFIDEIIKKVRFQFKNDPKNRDQIISKTIIYPTNVERVIDERQIYINKEKAIMISCTRTDGDNHQRKREIDRFLEIIKVYEQLKEQQIKLSQWGYRQFQMESITVQIEKCDIKKARQMIQKRETQLNDWKGEIKRLYEVSYKAAHLQGRKLKEFYDFIMDSQLNQIPNYFQIIIEDLEIHKSILGQLNINAKGTKFQQLSVIFSYFSILKTKVQQELDPNRDENFLTFLNMAKGDVDFMQGIKGIGSDRIRRLRFDQMLNCTSQTSKFEIKSFIQRALRDPDSQYIVLGFQNLDRRKQQYIVNQIKGYKVEYGAQSLKLKLCLVGDSELELLYKFAVQELNKSPQVTETVETVTKAYEKKLKAQCNKIKIVYSSSAGLGKTTFIKKDSFEVYQCTGQYYLPLSGIMAVPVEQIDQSNNNSIIQNQTEKFLWDRFEEAKNFFIDAEKKMKKVCLVIQIYNVEPSVIDIINKFLQSVLFFKSYKYKNNFGRLPKDIPIYIELENVSLPTYTKLSHVHANEHPQMRMLPFLREIKSVCGNLIIKQIEKFQKTDIKINKEDKELNYILYHLKLFKSGDINNTVISQFNQYQIQPIEQKDGLDLIQEYFFKAFKEGEKPSGYLWTYFRSLIFEACKSFNNSFYLRIEQIRQMDVFLRDVKVTYLIQQKKTLHQKLKLQKTFRSSFFNVIIQNALQFIKRSVKPGQQTSDHEFNKKMQSIPFLIIPNIDENSFSFIYTKSDKVPEVIKALIVLQTPKLVSRIANIPIQKLFQEENLINFEKNPNSKQWIEKASQILANISGNRTYSIDCEKGYVVNIDNFLKMCLIVQRARLNIPIVIMGEAGIGKTALLRHVVQHLYQHEFAVFNINAGLPLQSKKSIELQSQKNIDQQSKKKVDQKKVNDSLATIVENIKQLYQKIQQQNALPANIQKNKVKKLWVFFDEFNTLRELGFFKEIIIDGRYLGKEQSHIKNVVMMAACNPHKKLQLKVQQKQKQYVKEQDQKLAFDVLPAPHSLIECMWNYGGLTNYEQEKYISKMLVNVSFKADKITPTILKIHSIISQFLFKGAVSLRDIDRFRQLYRWFKDNLPRKFNVKVPSKLGNYNNIQERAFILSCYFTYILRFDQFIRKVLERQIENIFDYPEGYILLAKQTEENDLCSRLNFDWDAPIALNTSLKENLYSCFVCINTRLPLLIIGAPGCSKSLSLRILAKNLKEKINDQYLSKFKRMRQYPLQGSENTTTQDIKIVFQKAYKDLLLKNGRAKSREDMKQISVIVFDQIGLAQKSKDNPLKVLHPYLEVSREENLDERMISFIGISNSELDVSKMSRLLVLRRPPANQDDLIFTAQSIAAGYRYGTEEKIRFIIQLLTENYYKFVNEWQKKAINFPLFFGLRDLYGLIKIFMKNITENEIDISDDESILKCASESIFENFNGWKGTYEQLNKNFYESCKYHEIVSPPKMSDTLNSVIKTLDKESFRYPLVIVEDYESLCFVKWMIEKRYPNKSVYMEGSPFIEQKEYSLKLLGEICKYMDHECVLILSSLSEGVKTGLYDFFNKSFTVRASNNNKYLKIRTQEGSLNQIQYLYHERFNCVYLLLQNQLQDVQPPFLSRFQKYRFSLSQYRQELDIKILSKVEKFIQRVVDICKNNQMEHFSFNDLFINVNKSAMESLVVASYEAAGEEGVYKEALKRLVMNSGQYFFKIYKHYIEPKGDLPEIRQIMNQVIEAKNNGVGERNLIIRFTNDKDYTKKFIQKSIVSAQFVTFKKQADFDQELSKFFKSETKMTLYISLNVSNESIYLNYVTSQIQKARRRAIAENQRVQEKKIRLLYVFEKQKNKNLTDEISITHFTKFYQEFDDGRLDEMKNITKKELFGNVITIDSLFTYVHQAFDFKFENTQNPLKAQALFQKMAQNLYYKKDGLLSKLAQSMTLQLQTNLDMSQQVIKQMLLDKEITKKYKNYREALTKYFADKKLFGALAVFLKYLFDKESFMPFSSADLLEYYRDIEGCIFDSEIEQMVKETKSKSNGNYSQFINDMMQSKIPFITREYRTLKMIKKIPTLQKKFQVKLIKPRLLPFSKAESEVVLNYNQKQIGWYVKQIYSYDEKQEKDKFEGAMKTYEDEFKKKTTFTFNNQNLYTKFINEDKSLKTMLILDILSDFCEQKGLGFKYLAKFYQIISQFFAAEAKKNSKSDRTITFSKMICVLIGYEDIWVQIFKVCQTLNESGYQMKIQRFQTIASRENIKKYVEKIYNYLQSLLLGANIMNTFKNPEKYTTIYINTIFHLEKLEQLIRVSIPDKLKSTRTTLVFIQMFDVNNKVKHIANFMKFKSQLQTTSHYHDMYNYFQGLKDQASKEQKEKITQFEANQLFYEWFKVEPNNDACLKLFLANCDDEVFVHNSVATINLFINHSSFNKFNNIEVAFENLNKQGSNINHQLKVIGEQAKGRKYKNNLAILMINIFVQKLTSIFKGQSLIIQNDKKFENILIKIGNSQVSGIAFLFSFAYFKIYLKQYVTRLARNEKSVAISYIDDILRKQNPINKNLRFYCLKLLRTIKPIKEIKEEYIKKKKVHWTESLVNLFDEQQSRSISVPNEKKINVSPAMMQTIDAIIESHGGAFDLIDKLINEANTPYNRYALLNFFMRYYFSMSYNQKLYKAPLLEKLIKCKEQYSQKIGKVEFQLLFRYASSKFDDNLKVNSPAQFKQDLFVFFNSLNWLIASKFSTSPLHSLFFKGGEFHADFKAAFDNLFFPCGPENQYIQYAVSVNALTSNNNIGVYICSAECDYIYSLYDCGWPSVAYTCPVCGKGIGCKPGHNHTINRQEEGARRINSPALKVNSRFYVYNMTGLTNYWEMQRNYIQAEINRLKMMSVVQLGAIKIKLTGYTIEDSGRVSTLSYYTFCQNLNSILYCLLGLNVISQQQCTGIFGKNVALAQKELLEATRSNFEDIKSAVNLGNKVYGWIFGLQKNIYKSLINFQSQFNIYIGTIKEYSQDLARKLEQEIVGGKIANDYFELYTDMANALKKGLLTKELGLVFDMTAANRFTRDLLQQKVESFIKTYTTMQKFAFAQQNASLQGKMQFPKDVLLTEDELNEEMFEWSKILKIPDKEIKYNEIIINYELNIRQNYPFLDYILKNSDQISTMFDFYNILIFSNELAKEVEFNYERKDANKSLRQFIDELLDKKGERVHEILRNPEIVTSSWNRLANRMGVLQNDCTVVGKMNNQYSVETPIQAFLLDNTTKENLYGLTLSSLYHNFAKKHNELVVLLNARKNQIPQYKCLNLYNESMKIHPQKIHQNNIYMITIKQLEEQLYNNSISSINYGKNFIFNNFDSYQKHFLMKLVGKCEIISDIKQFKNICYNGEAFAQTSQSSNTLTEVRDYFYEELTREEVHQLQGFIRQKGNKQKIEQYVVKLRGDLEKIMISIRNLNGIIQAKSLGDFIEKIKLDDVTYELTSDQFGSFSVSKIVNFYQLLELQLKPIIIERLPPRYKESMDQSTQKQIRNLLENLPIQDENIISLLEFGYALYRFIARILQGGVQQNDKKLMEFLPSRNDFWPKGFQVSKLTPFYESEAMNNLTYAYAGHLFEIVERLITTKVGGSRI